MQIIHVEVDLVKKRDPGSIHWLWRMLINLWWGPNADLDMAIEKTRGSYLIGLPNEWGEDRAKKYIQSQIEEELHPWSFPFNHCYDKDVTVLFRRCEPLGLLSSRVGD